jgi:hypothetical protein
LEDQKKMFKDDINFLECPNWVLNNRSSVNTWVIEKPHGRYELTSLKGLPSHFDKIILYYLIYKLYKETELKKNRLVTNRYEIARNVFFNVKSLGKNHYSRLMKSLKKWKQIAINFEGVFYEDGRHIIKYFSFVDDVTLDKESGKLTIRFGEAYIEQLRETKFFRYIDFEQYKKLNRAVSARLYEILLKSFKKSNEWSIDIQKLAEKVTFEKPAGATKYYPSVVLRHIRPAVKEINKKTDLYITLSFNKNSGTCTFIKGQKPKELTPARSLLEGKRQTKPSTAREQAECYNCYMNLPQDEQERIKQAIERDQFIKVLPNEKLKIFAYMKRMNLYPS